MPTLTYTGEQTVDAQNVQALITSLANLDQDDSEITVHSASLRFEDGGSLRVITSLGASGGLAKLESLQESLATQASDLGFQSSDVANADATDSTDGNVTDSTDPTEGVELI